MSKRVVGLLMMVVTALAGASAAQAQVQRTRHNLSAAGPGAIRAPGVANVCIFCHTPHRATQNRALWNRDLPSVTYKLYESSTLEATLNQPTGASRLCLSCHDGTTALGSLRVPARSGRVTLGPLTGRASLGTDLSDDHPISFVYDSALALKQGQLADPASLPKTLPLDGTKQLQCTTCHEPHNDRYRKFLRTDDRVGALCTACHRQRNWTGSAHATSPAAWHGPGPSPWQSPYTTVADNSCENCHRSHAAPHPPRLLNNAQERGVCLVCHGGGVATFNLEAEFVKPSAHPIASTDWIHDPRENPNTMARHVTCVDCHNPHQAATLPASPPAAPGRLRGVRGVSVTGSFVTEATYEYEICLKCHGVRDQSTPGIQRQDNTRNVRLKISPSNPSYHPVASAGRNPSVLGFEPGYSTASVLYCTDCHNTDDWTPTSTTKPRGSHGSRYVPILEREYQTDDPSAESFQSFALCYKCHNRDFLINDRARTFLHQKHVVQAQAPCAVCHDAHGSRRHVGLINFMIRDRTGKTVVGPSQSGKRLEFVSLGAGRGQCYLMCHGKNHEPASYP